MSDDFDTLGLPPRLALDEEELRAAFREAGRTRHPDHGGSMEEFAAIQAAFARLSSPSQRLGVWLARQGDTPSPRGPIDPALADLFQDIGTQLQRTDILLRKRAESRSALARALTEPEANHCREAISALITRVLASIHEHTRSFPTLEAHPDPDRAATLARSLAFLEKWRDQLRDRFARLIA